MPVAPVAEGGRALVDHGGIGSAGGHCIGDGLDAFDALDGPDTDPVIHGNYDCVACIAVDYPLLANRCSSQFDTPI